MTGLVVLGIVVALVLLSVGLYNGLVRSRVRVDEAWAGIATQLSGATISFRTSSRP
jgi:hypothetical protein